MHGLTLTQAAVHCQVTQAELTGSWAVVHLYSQPLPLTQQWPRVHALSPLPQQGPLSGLHPGLYLTPPPPLASFVTVT